MLNFRKRAKKTWPVWTIGIILLIGLFYFGSQKFSITDTIPKITERTQFLEKTPILIGNTEFTPGRPMPSECQMIPPRTHQIGDCWTIIAEYEGEDKLLPYNTDISLNEYLAVRWTGQGNMIIDNTKCYGQWNSIGDCGVYYTDYTFTLSPDFISITFEGIDQALLGQQQNLLVSVNNDFTPITGELVIRTTTGLFKIETSKTYPKNFPKGQSQHTIQVPTDRLGNIKVEAQVAMNFLGTEVGLTKASKTITITSKLEQTRQEEPTISEEKSITPKESTTTNNIIGYAIIILFGAMIAYLTIKYVVMKK